MKMNKEGLPIIDRPIVPPEWLCIDRYRGMASRLEREKDYGEAEGSSMRGVGKGLPGMDGVEKNVRGVRLG